ncbi:copper resistance CopC/CopD family protein [Cohnella zeiphila]|uniref:Copper resistance protein CopC/CopD n=1 Tax=Cohnella zeiphila TaxID=2761120 RepID=A0A7X0SJG8_9BACL|nr:copper resistance protein CopC [Cohnella zeiphila]MBB6731104.1 copper resistance protein CopC/CopD [Cohnella zeiphila]
MLTKVKPKAGSRWRKESFIRGFALLIAVLALAAAWMPKAADAHAVLEKATPTQDARMDTSPAYVELLFNERLDNSAENKLLVLDSASRSVTGAKAERTQEGKGLKLTLPKLKEDHYTVTYDVISADGHPVSGAYVFTVGNPPPLPDSSALDPHAQVGHAGHDHGGGSGLTVRDFILYAARIVYYAGLLGLAGLLLWSLQRAASPAVRDAREAAIGFAGKFELCATLAYVVLSLNNLALGDPISEWGRILTGTTVGKLYAAQLLLALAAPLLRGMNVYARAFWVAVALFAEAWSGHAAAFDPISYSVGLDFVHLAAASVWGGGLVLLLLVWRKERTEAGRFALLFSKWALISFLLLWITGVLSVLDFLPSLRYLFYTTWGSWLLAKAGLSVLVVATAFLIRLRLRKGHLPASGLLRADVGLLAAIVLVVGILTYQNPLPANEPLHYHEMGNDMHVTLEISPNAPGDNEIGLKVWLPEKTGLPKKTVLRLQPLDRKDVGFIEVPLETYEDTNDIDDFPGFVKQLYKAGGPYLPFAGKWMAQIRVTDSADNELVRETTFRIY